MVHSHSGTQAVVVNTQHPQSQCMFDVGSRGRKIMWRITLRFVGSSPESGQHRLGHIPLAKAQSRGHTLLQRRLGNVVCAQEERETGCRNTTLSQLRMRQVL